MIENEDYAPAVAELEKQLQERYDAFCHLDDPAALARADELLSRIGQIDLEIEGLKSRENQRDLSIKFHWGHNHRFNPHKSVSGRMGNRHINLMAQFMTRYGLSIEHLEGKDVIDVGCWTGGTTLLLKALGARHVLALEEVQKYANACHLLVNDIYGQSGVTCDGANLYDLQTEDKYDIAYFPGVVYHLSDPVLGLRRLFNALQDGGEIFVETAGLDHQEPICRFEGNRSFHKTESENAENLNRGGWNWFVPSPSCLALWIDEAGFDEVNCFYSHVSGRVFGYGRRTRYRDITRAGFSVRDIE